MSLTAIIKEEALRLGFTLAGVTLPEPPPHWQAFQHWLSMGRHASMHYLTDPRRADPRLVLPGCRSILVLAVSYPCSSAFPAHGQPGTTGRVAAYAGGPDYHSVLPMRLKKLVSFIETQVGQPVSHRIYTDTGPLLERDLAQRAGLGWIGRNTCLIHPGFGSYLLLAEILLGIDLETDEPFSFDRCGTCTRCIQACPTGCILPDRTLDARLCISYLTIENKGEIPLHLRRKMGNWVFGCDICQQVCPWNKWDRAVNGNFDPEFSEVSGISRLDLPAEMTLTPHEFNRKFRGSPVLRSKRSGYLRNVAVALGNSGDPAALPALKSASVDPEPVIQAHARWAVLQIEKAGQKTEQ
jgi:epoxyqueuosine reductase